MTVNQTPTQTLHYRVAVPDDAARLQTFVKSAYRGESSRQGWTTEADLLNDERISVKACADDDTALIACCEVLRRGPDLAYFGMFAVDPTRQGLGLGRQVLAYAELYCAKTKTGEKKPFPYDELVNGVALRDDLYFDVLEKELPAIPVEVPV
ncbi:unnamed protein product [Parascedosporium putredinis]|uniref:N-acetyltransferase domain-containing protein n=1 Tax=Parascedosporium putredinis TaxID=1442378 RepID=A0A9P1MF49_9PEZI|nr:unnamed protein product [Parascedosporium putredinis]CAI8001768.1 unnamed protein product [Parascedosporium putredinis]